MPYPYDPMNLDEQDEYIRRAIAQMLEPDPLTLRSAQIDSTMYTPQSVARNFGIPMDNSGNYSRPDMVAGIFNSLNNKPAQIEYNVPRSAQFPQQNLQTAGAMMGIQQQAQMNPLELEQAQAVTGLSKAKATEAEARAAKEQHLASLDPMKTRVAESVLENIGKLQQTRLRAQQNPGIVMQEVGVTTPQDLERWFTQQENYYKSWLQALGIQAPDLTGGAAMPAPAPAAPVGGGGGGSRVDNFLKKYGG